jgi:hypothetical protein
MAAAYKTGLSPLTDGEGAVYFNKANEDGEKPCGVFNIPEPGAYTHNASCASPEATVMCLGNDGLWTSANVRNVNFDSETDTVSFKALKAGLCAVFSTE